MNSSEKNVPCCQLVIMVITSRWHKNGNVICTVIVKISYVFMHAFWPLVLHKFVMFLLQFGEKVS